MRTMAKMSLAFLSGLAVVVCEQAGRLLGRHLWQWILSRFRSGSCPKPDPTPVEEAKSCRYTKP